MFAGTGSPRRTTDVSPCRSPQSSPPCLSALLWGRQYAAGVTAGYAFWFVAAGALPAWLAYQVYRAVEWAVIPIRRLRRRNRTVPLPTPPPYSER
jgi:hypothetical protein